MKKKTTFNRKGLINETANVTALRKMRISYYTCLANALRESADDEEDCMPHGTRLPTGRTARGALCTAHHRPRPAGTLCRRGAQDFPRGLHRQESEAALRAQPEGTHRPRHSRLLQPSLRTALQHSG